MKKVLNKTLVFIGAATIFIMPFTATGMKSFAGGSASDNSIILAENNAAGGGGQSGPGVPGGIPGGNMPPQGGIPDSTVGPGGPPGEGPGGAGGPPGGPGNMGEEGRSSEPVVSAARSELSDFDAVKNQDAVTVVYDLGLMDKCSGNRFCPEDQLTLSVLAKAVAKSTLLVRGATPSDFIKFCAEKGLYKGESVPDKTMTGYEAAGMLLAALGVKGASVEAGSSAIDSALKKYDLKDGLTDPALSRVISRDNAARMIANALRLSDGSGSIPKVLHNSPVHLGSGTRIIDNTRIFYFGGSAVQNSGESVLVVRNSRIDGDTSVATAPLAGNPGNLLVAGSIRTTLALGKAQAFYVNSEVNSKNWAALSTDGATMVTEPGQTELSVYAYGSIARTLEGGYGTYSDLFCNVYFYGTRLDSAEIAIISGTYGAVTVGTIGDGEANKAMAAHLIEDDRKARSDKGAGSVITGGRNALMIHSVNLPPYWTNKGYSKEEIPFLYGKISVHGSTLATDLSLDKNVEYTAEKQAYINHHSGSVILVKSANADIILDKAVITADRKGTGAVIHTVINNDTMFMTKVPDGTIYPGVKVSMKDMEADGDILHEDYQRDMHLSLTSASLTGRITSGTVEGWNALCKEKGFEAYLIDSDGYKTVHGVNLTLNSGSVWNVTGESTLTALNIEAGAVIAAQGGKKVKMTVDGVDTPIKAGTYKGRIVLSIIRS